MFKCEKHLKKLLYFLSVYKSGTVISEDLLHESSFDGQIGSIANFVKA